MRACFNLARHSTLPPRISQAEEAALTALSGPDGGVGYPHQVLAPPIPQYSITNLRASVPPVLSSRSCPSEPMFTGKPEPSDAGSVEEPTLGAPRGIQPHCVLPARMRSAAIA